MQLNQQASHVFGGLGERALGAIAEVVAFAARPGDLILLEGDLGVGKTTFARAFIRALVGGRAEEVVSPTFTLVQSYDTARMPVAHFDLYRLDDAAELGELGLEHALERGAALVEWPERAEGVWPASHLRIRLEEEHAADTEAPRRVALHGRGDWAPRIERVASLVHFLAESGWGEEDCALSYLQGDASTRRYARIKREDGRSAVLMDAPRQPDGPPIQDGLPYSRIAHLAEDVRPFVAIAGHLRQAGFSAPEVLAHDLRRGMLVLEDLGDEVFARLAEAGGAIAELWQAATDMLVGLREVPVPVTLPLPDGSAHVLPSCDRAALAIETELLVDWYWPAAKSDPIPARERAEFQAAWDKVFDKILVVPPGLVLRDFHSPNLLWLAQRAGPERVGIIDFQDALRGPAAYDLVSLLQDARVDVSPALEARLFEHYCAAVGARQPGFDREAFAFAYAALGAQRNTKILGIFARLARRDAKPGYLRHLPRIWAYLARDLEHPRLEALKRWYDLHFPPQLRTGLTP
jgi:tRNA threonylcarbamoyl adenosine modification protein YjeE